MLDHRCPLQVIIYQMKNSKKPYNRKGFTMELTWGIPTYSAAAVDPLFFFFFIEDKLYSL